MLLFQSKILKRLSQGQEERGGEREEEERTEKFKNFKTLEVKSSLCFLHHLEALAMACETSH